MRKGRPKTRIQQMSYDEWVEVCQTNTLNEIVRGMSCSSSTIYSVAKKHDFFPYMLCAYKGCGYLPSESFATKNNRRCKEHSAQPRGSYGSDEECVKYGHASLHMAHCGGFLRNANVQGAW